MKKYVIIILILIIMIICIYIGICNFTGKNIQNINEYINDTESMIIYDQYGNPLKDLSDEWKDKNRL